MDFCKAGPNKRVFAFLLDYCVASIIAATLYFLGIKLGWVIIAIFLVLKDCYNGTSIGKFFTNIKVVNEKCEDTDIASLIIRNIFIAIPLFPLIEYFVMMHDNLGRRLGDKIAKTQVTDLNPEKSDKFFLLLSIICLIFIILIQKIFFK